MEKQTRQITRIFFSTQVNKFLVIKVPGNVGRKGGWCGLCESDYVYQRVDGYLHLPVCVEATVNAASQGRNIVWYNRKAGGLAQKTQEEGLCTAKKTPQVIVHVPARVGGGPAGRGREPPLPGFMVGVLARGIIVSWSICGDEQRCRVEERHGERSIAHVHGRLPSSGPLQSGRFRWAGRRTRAPDR